MVDGILTPCNVARSWHWFRQTTAPCNRDSEFSKWQHPAMWYVALGSWHWFANVAGGFVIIFHWIRPNVHHIGILHLVSISTISPQSTCHSALVCEILSKSDHRQQKKMTSCRFSRWRNSAILDFRGPIMDSLKSPCTTSYKRKLKSSIETIALNCFLFDKIALLHFGDRQTNKQMDNIDALSRCR